MQYKIEINRHCKEYNKYLKEIINQSEMIKVVSKENFREIKEDESIEIDNLVLDKHVFPASLSYLGKNMGFLCLDNIDWENRNCRFKCVIFKDYIDLINKQLLQECIEYILNFSFNKLRLRRVSGIMKKDSYGIEVVNKMFSKEGENINHTKFYYGTIA